MESKKRLALAIIDFLSTSLKDGTLSSEDQASIEVAQTCIAESFKVDPSDKAAVQDALGGQNLLSIYGVYEKLKGKGAMSGATGSAESSSSASARPTPAASASGQPNKEAEALKAQGNSAMAKKDYAGAIEAYSKALKITPENPVYLSNRAAAYSASHQHEKARADAEMAVALDPTYTKAWSRLGLARFALGDAKGSLEAYQKGIDHEGNGGSEAMRKGYETAKKKLEEDASLDDDDAAYDGGQARSAPGGAPGGMPDLSGLASMLGGGGGGGGRGGMPDLGAMMNNPMFAGMAQKVMSNPQLMESLLNNPNLGKMAESLGRGGGGGGAGRGAAGRGGGMPDLSALMSDPSIAEM